jgi:hypothetical protein
MSTARALLERLVTEGLDTLHHPGIVYRDGPTGRRAALAVGPDVWEVITLIRDSRPRAWTHRHTNPLPRPVDPAAIEPATSALQRRAGRFR